MSLDVPTKFSSSPRRCPRRWAQTKGAEGGPRRAPRSPSSPVLATFADIPTARYFVIYLRLLLLLLSNTWAEETSLNLSTAEP